MFPFTPCSSERVGRETKAVILDHEPSPYMLFSFPYLAFLLMFAKTGLVNHPLQFCTHLRMLVLSWLGFFFNQKAHAIKVSVFCSPLSFSEHLPSAPKHSSQPQMFCSHVQLFLLSSTGSCSQQSRCQLCWWNTIGMCFRGWEYSSEYYWWLQHSIGILFAQSPLALGAHQQQEGNVGTLGWWPHFGARGLSCDLKLWGQAARALAAGQNISPSPVEMSLLGQVSQNLCCSAWVSVIIHFWHCLGVWSTNFISLQTCLSCLWPTEILLRSLWVRNHCWDVSPSISAPALMPPAVKYPCLGEDWDLAPKVRRPQQFWQLGLRLCM